jgi:hypothetical protein
MTEHVDAADRKHPQGALVLNELTGVATVVDALGLWATWSQLFPPVSATGDWTADAKLSMVFRDLAAAATQQERLGVIEAALPTLPSHVIPDHASSCPSVAVLMRWWLDIWEAAQ